MEPAGIEPAGMEPAGIEPAGPVEASPVRSGSRDAGIAENGAAAMPAGTASWSEVSSSVLTLLFVTLTVTVCCARSLPSAIACTLKTYVPSAVLSGTLTVM